LSLMSLSSFSIHAPTSPVSVIGFPHLCLAPGSHATADPALSEAAAK
jgi:hypothetical protein